MPATASLLQTPQTLQQSTITDDTFSGIYQPNIRVGMQTVSPTANTDVLGNDTTTGYDWGNPQLPPPSTTMTSTPAAPTTLANKESIASYTDQAAKTLEANRIKQQNYDASIVGQASPYIKAGTSIAQGVGSLANIYLGFQQLGIQKEQMSMAKEQWAETKQELARVKKSRVAVSNAYFS